MKYFQLRKIYKDIKSIKIQGATNIAKAAVTAYSLSPKKSTIRKLHSLRPTEPLLQNVLKKLEKGEDKNKILNHFSQAQEKINFQVLKILKNNEIIFTHCHSTNVVKSLINAKKQGKKFEVYNTETRPIFQGRKTTKELFKAGIKVTMFIDSALGIALTKNQGTKKTTKVFLGADAILKNGDVVNKVGSGVISEIAKKNNIPVYIIADSWKFSKKNLELEQRSYKEIWDNNVPKKIKIMNPAFEKVPSKNIKAIISELGILTPKEFVKKTSKLI
jgi:ribose 1,5-bisphosphate isomerase